MKQIKITAIALLTLFTTAINAQEQESKEKTKKGKAKHEVGLDFLELIQYNKIELSYSYILNKSNSIGTTIHFIPAASVYWANKNYEEHFAIDINYKHYFSKNYAQGFYVEGFAKYGNGYTHVNFSSQPFVNSVSFHRISLGFGVGYKYVTKNDYFFDVKTRFSGAIYTTKEAESLIPSDDFDFSVTIGKRF